jgi:putative glutamine amidotransferase
VGLNCSLRRAETDGVRQSFISEHYYNSVSAAGGVPVLLPPVAEPDDVDSELSLLNGLALIGGDDINPARYGRERHAKTEMLEARREEFDVLLARRALERGLAVLAICGGCQLINVVLGGTLHQHVPEVYGEDVAHGRTEEMRRGGIESMHEARIEKGSLLHEILGMDAVRVNSSHHQSVDVVADGLCVSARAADGVVEALEWSDRKKPFLLAVQWHPERLGHVTEHLRLFQALVQAARK